MSQRISEIHKLIFNLVEDQRTVIQAAKDAEQYLSDSVTNESILDKILNESPNNFALRSNPISTEDLKTLLLEKHKKLLDDSLRKREEFDDEGFESLLIKVENDFEAELRARGCIPEDFVQLDLEITRVLLSPKSLNAIYQSLYILTFANFEAFLHQLTKHCISGNDLILMGGSKKTFSWSEIREEGAVTRIRQSLIEDAADKLMHQSMDHWLDWYQQKVKLKINKDFRHKCQSFYTLRNYFAHEKSSRSLYQNVASKALVNDAADLLLLLAFKVSISLVQKQADAEQLDEYLSRLSDTTVKLLQKERFRVVADLCSFIFDLQIDAVWMDLYKVNYWIAQKELAGIENYRQEISEWDVSGKEAVYQLAKFSLLGQKEPANELFKNLESEGRLSKIEWETWPLFNSVK